MQITNRVLCFIFQNKTFVKIYESSTFPPRIGSTLIRNKQLLKMATTGPKYVPLIIFPKNRDKNVVERREKKYYFL